MHTFSLQLMIQAVTSRAFRNYFGILAKDFITKFNYVVQIDGPKVKSQSEEKRKKKRMKNRD